MLVLGFMSSGMLLFEAHVFLDIGIWGPCLLGVGIWGSMSSGMLVFRVHAFWDIAIWVHVFWGLVF